MAILANFDMPEHPKLQAVLDQCEKDYADQPIVYLTGLTRARLIEAQKELERGSP
jgi:hypothetical protein